MLFVLPSSYLKIESGEFLKKAYGPSSVKCVATVISEAETWNFNLRNITLYLLISKIAPESISSLLIHKKLLVTKNFRFEGNTRVQLLELPSGNLLLSLTGSHEIFKIVIDSNGNLQVDRFRLNGLFLCMTTCHMTTYSYLIVGITSSTLAVYRIEGNDDLIFVVCSTNDSNSNNFSNLLWHPLNELLLSKYTEEAAFRVWTLTTSGGLIKHNNLIKLQREDDLLLEANVLSLQNNQLLAFNSNKDQEAFTIYRII